MTFRSDLVPLAERAYLIVERGRFCKNLARLRRTVGPLSAVARRTNDLGRYFVLLGLLDGLRQRGAFQPWAYPFSPTTRQARLHTRLVRWSLDLWRRYLGRTLSRKYANQPEWNDYLMTVWFMTGSPQLAHDLYCRAVMIPPVGSTPVFQGTAASARWMVSSVRARHADFDAAISGLESHYGLPVSSLLPGPPASFFQRPLPPGVCSHCGCTSGGLCNCPCHTLPARSR